MGSPLGTGNRSRRDGQSRSPLCSGFAECSAPGCRDWFADWTEESTGSRWSACFERISRMERAADRQFPHSSRCGEDSSVASQGFGGSRTSLLMATAKDDPWPERTNSRYVLDRRQNRRDAGGCWVGAGAAPGPGRGRLGPAHGLGGPGPENPPIRRSHRLLVEVRAGS